MHVRHLSELVLDCKRGRKSSVKHPRGTTGIRCLLRSLEEETVYGRRS
jgi:hypothetical protein